MALVGLQQFTALSGPVSHHASLRVIPERTVGIIVVLFLQETNTREAVIKRALQYARLTTEFLCAKMWGVGGGNLQEHSRICHKKLDLWYL